MQVVLCIESALFGGLSLIAAVSQIKSDRKAVQALVMAAGSLLLIVSVILNILGQPSDLVAAIPGCTAICAAAIWNGIKGGQFHIQHHIIRIALSILLVIGFVAY